MVCIILGKIMFEFEKFDISKIKKGLFFLPLGGVGEIGANCYLYSCDDSWIMIDLGVSFADEKPINIGIGAFNGSL